MQKKGRSEALQCRESGFLFKNGFRFRLHKRSLPGNPDIVLKKHNTVLFINGCFWHAHHGCKFNKMPKSRTEYWIPKITGNAARDVKKHGELRALGWKVVVVWECELKKEKQEESLKELLKDIKNG